MRVRQRYKRLQEVAMLAALSHSPPPLSALLVRAPASFGGGNHSCDSRTAPLPPQFPIPNPQILLFRTIESIKARPRIFKQPADIFISAD